MDSILVMLPSDGLSLSGVFGLLVPIVSITCISCPLFQDGDASPLRRAPRHMSTSKGPAPRPRRAAIAYSTCPVPAVPPSSLNFENNSIDDA